MSDLVEFLLARITEDEEEARFHPDAVNWPDGVTPIGGLYTWVGRDGSYGTGITEEHLLAECEAKRRIIEEHGPSVNYGEFWACSACGELDDVGDWAPVYLPCQTLRLLSLPYADHPDYDAEWRPWP